jgi:hypothetical protein
LNSLEDDTVYRCIYIGVDDKGGIHTSKKSFFVTKRTSPYFMLNNFKFYSGVLINRYLAEEFNFVRWRLGFKKWILHNVIKMDAFKAVVGLIDSLNDRDTKALEKGAPVKVLAETSITKSTPFKKLSGDVSLFREYDPIVFGRYGTCREDLNGVKVYSTPKYIINANATLIDDSYKVLLMNKDNPSISIR